MTALLVEPGAVDETALSWPCGEFAMPAWVERHPHEARATLRKPSIYTTARARVQEILEGPVVGPLSEDVAANLDDILRRADGELKEE